MCEVAIVYCFSLLKGGGNLCYNYIVLFIILHDVMLCVLGGYYFLRNGGFKYSGGHNFLKEK